MQNENKCFFFSLEFKTNLYHLFDINILFYILNFGFLYRNSKEKHIQNDERNSRTR